MSRKINAAVAAALGGCTYFGISSVASAQTLAGTLTDGGGTVNQSGSVIGTTGTVGQLTLGLTEAYAQFSGNASTGVMTASASAGMNGDSSSSISYSTTITNDGATASPYFFDVTIANSQLLAVNQYSYPTGSGSVTAGISAMVQLDGATVWSSSASLNTTNDYANTYNTSIDPYTYTTSGDGFAGGTVLDVYLGSGPFDGTPYELITYPIYTNSIPLGILAPGESESLTYTLSADTLFGSTGNNGFEGYGGAVATVGDPFSTGSPAFGVVAGTEVPEPDSFGLTLSGIAGLAMVARLARRRGASRNACPGL